jgi:energy-coupling factor transport system substrate-specific component
MRLTARELVSLSLMGAITVAGKELMAFLPNIEPVTLFLLATTLVYGAKALYPCLVFVLLEGLLYGFGWWFFFYLYVWPILVGVALLLRRWNLSWILWTVVGGLFGLFFGPLSALQSLVVGGWPMAFSYWVSGIPFDVLHCVGNAVMCGLFLKPLTGLMTKLAYPSP